MIVARGSITTSEDEMVRGRPSALACKSIFSSGVAARRNARRDSRYGET